MNIPSTNTKLKTTRVPFPERVKAKRNIYKVVNSGHTIASGKQNIFIYLETDDEKRYESSGRET